LLLKPLTNDKGITGRTLDEAIPYLAIGYSYFAELSAYQNSLVLHAEIVGDILNYTPIQLVVQFCEIFQ